jgi:excisionase family DNA binding protein
MSVHRAPISKLAYSVEEVSRLVPMGHSKIYEEIAAGRLVARKNGRQTLILAHELADYLEALPRISAAGLSKRPSD